MKNSIVNIESVTNNSFGTGFVIDSNEKGIYILTCQHVLDDVVTPVVENVLAKVVAKSDFIDMAVLYVSKLHLEPLPLQIDVCDSLNVEVIGFSHFNKSVNQKKHIEATLYKESIELHSNDDDDLFYNVRKIKANDGFNFDRGNSGSPVICKNSGKVIAMISNKEGSDIGYAVDIVNLKDVWEGMPSRLLREEIVKVSGVKDSSEVEEKKPIETEQYKEKKSSPLKYIVSAILVLAISLGVYYYIKSKDTITQTQITPNPDIPSNHPDYKKAEELERAGYQALIDRDFKKALYNFQESEKSVKGYHKVYEVAKELRKNLHLLHKKEVQRAVIKRIIALNGKAPIDLIAKLKRELIEVEDRAEILKEDCISFSNRLLLREKARRWFIIDNENHLIFRFHSQQEGLQAIRTIKHYRINKSCFVGRPNPSFKYMLSNNQAPTGAMLNEDCTTFNPNRLSIKRTNSKYIIADGSHYIFSFENISEAKKSLSIIKKYGFSKTCYIGRPNPSFTYLKR